MSDCKFAVGSFKWYRCYKEADFSEAEKAAREVLAIPIYPELTNQMKDYVAEIIISHLS